MVQSLFVATVTTVLTLIWPCLPLMRWCARSCRTQPAARPVHDAMLVPVIVLGLGLYLQFSNWGLLDTTTGLVLSHIMLTTPSSWFR